MQARTESVHPYSGAATKWAQHAKLVFAAQTGYLLIRMDICRLPFLQGMTFAQLWRPLAFSSI
eukprot:9605066-Prorocentrum_lima.AAC.1